ncbi:MAG: hypothetical protein BEN18_01910 [Epulopiscium sp. Nuni2H_MBin001]|nr:MAG: hypothetical protein BEN18_01910 [Epulopiscium sp. Nuni2H_MBin001]
MQKKYKAAIYLRLSFTDDKSIESDSIINQRAIIMDFLQSHTDIEVVSEKVDNGYSGLVFDRPEFKEMMDDIVSGKIDCVVVKDLSRLGREYIETGEYLRKTFPKYGVRFIAVTDNIDTIKDRELGGKLDVTLKTLMNDSYSRDISKKTRTALDIKRKNGECVLSSISYGYKRSETNKNKLEIDEISAIVVQDIYMWKKEGISPTKIATRLNEQGVLSPSDYKANKQNKPIKNTRWTTKTVIRILQNPIYIGTLTQGKVTTHNYKLKQTFVKPKDEWSITENAHTPIIEKDLFDLIQQLMLIDTRTAPNKEQVHLFAGMLICGCCGNRYSRKTERYKDKVYHYYYCMTGKKNGCTDSKPIKQEELIASVIYSIKAYIQNVMDVDKLEEKAMLRDMNSEKLKKYELKLAETDRLIQEAKKYKQGLYESLNNNIISRAEYKEFKSTYDMRIKKFSNSRLDILQSIDDLKNNPELLAKWREQIIQFANLETLDRATLVQLIHSITVNGKDGIVISFRNKDEYTII